MSDFSTLLNSPELNQLMTLIERAGYDIRCVGGGVRDALLGQKIGDIDLATTARPEQIMDILAAQNIQVVPTGIKHGTVTAVINRKPFEITTLRHDIETDGRHAEVAFHTDWAGDARRRDFTINALSVDRSGKLHDYCGGVADLEGRRLRFIDDPEQRMREDYLRLLRYFRFASTLDWALDTPTVQICSRLAPHLTGLSRERVQSELYKLVMGSGCYRVVATMMEYDILPAFKSGRIFDRLTINDAFLRLIALTGWDNDEMLEKLVVLSREQKKRLRDMRSIDPSQPLHKLLYFYGLQAVSDYNELYQMDWNLRDWKRPEFPLKAEHVMPLTGGPGKRVGEMMDRAEHWWVEHSFTPGLPELLEYLKTC